MKIFNYFSKLVLISMLSVLSFNSLGQKIVMDSVAFASPQIVCNPDTVSFFFRTGVDTSQPNLPFPPFTKPPYSNTDIHVDLPDGFRYIDIVYTESVNIGNVPAINIDGSNPNDLIFSWNGFMLNPYATLFELKLLVEPSCGANTSAASAFITRGGSTFPLSDTISTSLIQVDEPYLVFQGVSNTTNNNSSIALNRLAIGQKIRRCFKIDYTSLISSIDEITIKIDNSNQYYSFDWVTPGVTRTTVNDTVIYTFDAAFFTTIGDLDGVIEPGESLTFCDSVTVLGNCNSQNSNVKVDYVMSWGCGGFNCQSTTVAAEGVIALSPTQIITSPRPDLDIQPNLCDTCGTGKVRYGFEFYNNTKAVLSTGGFLTDLKFELGTARHPHTIASNPYLDSLNHCFDTVKINGVAVPFTQGVNAVIEISNLTSFSGTGLADIDGDGFFDDLAAGDTLVFELIGTFYANRLDTSALAYNLNGGNNDPTGTPYLIDPIRAGLDVTYYDECGGNEKEDRILSDLYVYLNPRQSSSSVTPDFFDRGSYVYTMTHSEQNLASSYECDSALRETIMILPKDVSLDTTLAYPFSTYPSNSTDSVVYWVEKDGLNDVDTLYVYYNTKGEERNGAARQSSVTLRYDCSGGICPEADSLRTIAWYQNYICINDLDVECFKTAMYRGKRLVRFHCDLPPQGISLRTFEMKRTTYGFTDSTETTKVNANTPGIALHRAQVSDTVRLTLKGVVNDAVLDSAHARFSYHTQQNQGGQKPVFRIDDVNSTVTIYDASAATYNTFRLNSPGLFSGEFGPQQAGTGTNEDYDFQWNLSSYKDSIGGGYQFTGGLLNSSTWDSIIMNIVMVVEDNSYSGDYQLDPYAQMVELPEDTATQCDIYGTLFAVNQDPLTVFARASSSFGSCISRANVVEFRTGIEDDFPNEYKRNEKINEIRFSWDPTYFNDPDSVTYTYYWRDSLGNNISGAQFVDRIAQFTQNGNSITIPMEKSANINVLPEAWHWGYVRVYQTATCAIMDSMPIAQLGIKAEMDVERFTNSSATTVVTQYDSTFSYYGNQSANILVDIPTPFNITSSPIVASTSADSVCWEVSYNNLSFTDINNTWLDFSADSIQVTSISRIDSGFNESQTILSYGTNGIWIQTDTIRSNDFKTYKVCAQYSTCQLDSIVLTGGWNCDKYPTTPTSGYAPTAYSCEHNQQTMAIYIEELEAKLQTVIVNSSTMPFNLCDTLFYDVQIANIDLTDMKDLVFSATFPSTSNLSVDPGTTSMIWSYDGINTTEITIPDPVRIGDSIAWDLTGQFSSSFLRNFESINDSNYALMKVRFNTNCVMFPNDAIKFRVEGTRGCNKRVVSRETSSEPFQVAGLKAQANRLTDIQIYLDTIQACDTATQVDLSFFNIFTKPTRGSEVLAVTLPASFDISGSIYNRHRDTLLQSVVPTNTVVGNLRTLEWLVEPGMPVAGPTGIPGADSLSFSFNIVPVTNVTCAIDTLIEAKVFERYFIFCVTDSSIPCEIIYPLDEDREAFTVTKGDLSLNSISTVLDGCTDSIDINFGFTNNGTNIANGTPTVFKIYVDVNGNGIADPTDPIFDSIVYTDSIPRGATGTINLSTSAANYTVAEICNLVVQVDSMSSCVCDTASVALPVTLNMNLKDSTLCAIDTLNLGVCSGTSYSGRTYTWYDVDGLGRESFLSNVNGLSPTFNPPAVASATTYRFAVQVNRGGCIDEDTLTIIVRSSPSMFDVVDDTICEDDCITLAIGSAQPGITYNVFDGVGSFLGTLPYLACPTNTTTYFFEAIDSAGNCSDVLDTAVITVVGKMSPGSSTTIAGCGLGCTINLYDTLGGTPDTTGTWTDPSGNPFGTGYNVTFNANTNPVGVYTYTISNMPCADTMATVTILSTIDTVPVTTLEDIPVTVGSPSIGGAGPISTITSTNGPGFGTVTTDPTSGTITYDPDSNFIGFDTVNIIVCYTAGSCDTTVLTITVLPVRDTTPVTTNEDTPFTLCPGTDSTTKVRNLGSTTVECGPNHGTIDPINQTTGCVTYTPDPNYVGVDTICIIVCDTIAGMCDTTLIPITVVPVRDTIMDTIAEGDTLTLCPPTTTDTDVLGGVSLVCGPNNGTVTFNDPTAGCVKYVPNPGFSGSDTLCIVICDVNGVCDTTTVLITIDPVTDTIPLVTLEDIPVSVGQPTLSGVTPVTVTSTNGPTHGTVSIDSAGGVPTGTITYTPDTNYVGFDTVTIITCDATPNCDTTVVVITVNPVRDTVPMTIDEDSSFVISPRTDSLTDVDSLGGTILITPFAKFGTPTVDPVTGAVTYQADPNFVGVDTIMIIVNDTVSGFSDTTLVPITIVPVRDTLMDTIPEGGVATYCPPTITVVDSLGSMDTICPPMNGTMTFDTITGCVTYTPNLNYSGTDTICFVKCDTAGVCDTTTIVVTTTPVTDTIPLVTLEDIPVSVGQPTLSGVTPVTVTSTNGPTHGTVSIDSAGGVPTGTITYTPDTNYVGFDTVTIITCDATPNCDTTIVVITVNPVRDTVPMTIDEDSSFVISPRTDSLTDVDSLGGTAVIIPFAKHGTTSIDPVTGSVTYKPDTNYVGADTITVVVTDTISGFSDTTLVPINVIPVRDTIYRTINSGGADTLCPPSTTDTDSLGSVTLICGPTLGDTAIDQTTGCVTYSTLSNQFGNDTLCIVTTDINGVSDTTTVIYTILKTIDTIPVIVPEDSTFTLCPPVTTRRPNVDSVAKLCEPTHGTATLDTNGCITYKPDSNYIGYDTICIITIDSNGVADTTIFPITLIPVVDTVPLIVDEDDSIVLCPNTDSTTRVDMLGNVVVDCLPQFGTTTIDSNGCVTYKPFQNFVGVDSFCIIMTDSGGFSDTTYYPITIVPVRDTIIDTLVSDSITFCMPTTTRVDSLGGVSVLCPPSFAVATIIDSVTGCVTYVRDSTYAGNDTLCIVICDTAGVCDTTTVILTVPRIFTPFNVANDSICEGDCVTLMADTMQPGVIYRVHSPRGTIIGRLSTPTVVCPSTDSTFFIEAWDSITGVTSIWDTMTIFVTKFRSPGVSDSISLCETGTIVNLYDSLGTPVIGAKDTTGTWTGPTSLPFGTGYLGAFNPLTDTVGVYTYTIVNPVCPDTSATITVTKYSAPNPGMFDSIALCQSGQSSDLLNSLLGTPDAGGTWAGPVATTNGDLGTLDPSIGIPGRGNYVYTVSKFGCADDSSYVNVWIDTIENDSIRMEDTALCKGLESAQVFIMGATGGTFSTNAMPSDNLNIDPVTGLLTFSNRLPFETRSGQYEVYYTTSGPCPETDTITIDMKVYGEGCQVEIPQFISPNGDGINDVLDIPGIEEFPNNVLKIFNRWGNIVYEKPGYDNTWDGSTNASRGVNQVIGDGDKLPAGTYFYIFESGDDRYPAFSGYVYVK